MQGGKFLSGAAAGFLGHLGGAAWGEIGGKFAGSNVGGIAFGALSGGIGAEFTGGNFWTGAITGGIVAGLNGVLHEGGDPKPKPKKATQGTLSNKEVTSRLVDLYDDSNLTSASSIIGQEGMVLNKAELLIEKSAKGASFANRRHVSKTLKFTSKAGKFLGGAGIVVSLIEDYSSANGLTWGTAAKVGIGGLLLGASAPVSLTCAAIDIGWGLATGTTITDNVANYINQKTK